MPDIIGIDHIYITVSDLARSEVFYDAVLRDCLGFRKNSFTLGGERGQALPGVCAGLLGYLFHRPRRPAAGSDQLPPGTARAA